jgi:hypothetical protein
MLFFLIENIVPPYTTVFSSRFRKEYKKKTRKIGRTNEEEKKKEGKKEKKPREKDIISSASMRDPTAPAVTAMLRRLVQAQSLLIPLLPVYFVLFKCSFLSYTSPISAFLGNTCSYHSRSRSMRAKWSIWL